MLGAIDSYWGSLQCVRTLTRNAANHPDVQMGTGFVMGSVAEVTSKGVISVFLN